MTDHDHGKHVTTIKFNKLTLQNFVSKLLQANIAG